MPRIKGIVIAGNSGSGKDTLATFLQFSKYLRGLLAPVKFSDAFKDAIASYLGVDRALMDDREFRVKPIPFLDGISTLDLLVKGFEVMPQLHPKLGLYRTQLTVDAIMKEGKLAVFTDTRNPIECSWLLQYFKPGELLIIWVDRPSNESALKSDRFQPSIYESLAEVHPSIRITNSGTLAYYGNVAVKLSKYISRHGLK